METEKDTPKPSDDVTIEEQTTGDAHLDLIAQAEAELDQDPAEDPKTDPEEKDIPTGKEEYPEETEPADPQADEKVKKLEKLVASWPEEERKQFFGAPAELQELLGKHYRNMLTDYKRKTQEASALRSSIEQELAALRPVVHGKYRNMADFAQYVSEMQNFEAEFKRDPRRTLAILAQEAGLDLAELGSYEPDPAAEAMRPLQAEMAQIRELLSHRAHTPQPAPQEDEDVRKQAQEFADAVDANGNKLHPHFADAAPFMGLIMQRDGHSDLEKAYQEALYSLPSARAEILKKQQASAAAKKAELDKAHKAGKVHLKTSGISGAKPRPKGIIDLIAETEKELDGE